MGVYSKYKAWLRRRRAGLAQRVYLGVHHKTGTKWMGSIFRTVAKDLGLTFTTRLKSQAWQGGDIHMQWQSNFSGRDLACRFRGIHIIRDPRDQLVSACFYHQRAHEAWLLRPQKQYNGATYQETINSQPDPEERLLFEMRHSSRCVCQAMSTWNYNDPRFLELKYEDLVVDSDLRLFRRIFLHLGFHPHLLPMLLDTARANSLFSGEVTPENTPHVRSGRPGNWREHFTPRISRAFLDMHGDILIRLGYEKDHSWV